MRNLRELPAMEAWLSMCLVALCTLLAATWLVKLSVGKNNKSTKKMPPGPWALPIIGSLHRVASVLPPHRRMMKLSRRHGPVMFLRLGEVPTVVVSSAQAATELIKTNDLALADRPRSATVDLFGSGGKGVTFAPYGDHWRQMRKIVVMELLSSPQVKRMEGIRVEELGGLLRDITASAGATINISDKATALSNHVVTRAVFGGKFAQQGEYLCELDRAFTLLGGFCLLDLFPSSRLVLRWLSNAERQMKRCHGRIHRIIAGVVEERKASRALVPAPGDGDMLDVLLRLQQEDTLKFPLTTQTMGAILFEVFAGGTETTGNILVWAMSELMRSPNSMARAQQEVREVLGEDRAVITNSDLVELHYMRMIIKEVLRLHPPNPLVPRMAREDFTVMGYDIPQGTNLYINVFAISQDSRYWDNPEEFRPERFENNNVNYNGTYFEFIPFGAGRRQCPGIQFSSSLTEMALTNFLYHFDWMLPDGANPTSVDMSEKFGLSVRRKYGLQLRAIPHVWSKATSLK